MSHELRIGDLAVVIKGKGDPNNVRRDPRIGARIKGKIPEHAILAILAEPTGWAKAYPYDDGTYVWFYVRGRTKAKHADGRFKVVEGWTASSQNGRPFLSRMVPSLGCRDTMGTALDTHLGHGQQAYVLPADGLNVRKEADPLGDKIGGLLAGTVVTVMGDPKCDTKMVWWQVKPLNASGPSGWASEGNILEWFLAPLTLM
jgi:hypothetical protein